MKVLIIRPPDSSLGKLKKIGGVIHPINITSLGTYINSQHDVKILDLEAEPFTKDQLGKYISSYGPDIVGITVVTPHYKNAVEISHVAKELGKLVVWGGPHPTILPEDCLKNNVDIVVRGEGEFTFNELLTSLEKNKTNKNYLSGVKGISYKNGEKIYHNERRAVCENLDVFPVCNRRMLKLNKYRGEITPGITKMSTQLLTGRGCPFYCTYCSAHLMHGRGYRVRSISHVMEEVKDIYSLGFRHMSIDDDSFTFYPKRVYEFCDNIKKDFPDMTWNCDSRVTVNYEMLKAMKDAGCEKISFGVESGSQRILDVIKKGITVAQIKDAFKAAKKAKLKTQAFMMIGHPTETMEDINHTINIIKQTSPDYLFLSISTPYPGTELYKYMVEKGHLKQPCKWEDFIFFGDEIDWDLDNFKRGEIVNLRNKIYKNYYLTPKYILSRLKHLNNFQELKYYFKGFFTLLNFTKKSV